MVSWISCGKSCWYQALLQVFSSGSGTCAAAAQTARLVHTARSVCWASASALVLQQPLFLAPAGPMP